MNNTAQLSVNQTHDLALLESFLKDPEIYGHVTDDSSPPIKEAKLSPEGLYLLVELDSPVGFFALEKHGDFYQVHTVLSKACRGRDAVDAGVLGRDWMFENTDTTKLTSLVLEGNRAAAWFARICGFTETANEVHPVPVHGKYLTATHFEITRESWEKLRRNNLCL